MPRPKKKTDLEIQAGLEPQELAVKNNRKGKDYTALTTRLASERLRRLKQQNSKLSLDLRKMRGQIGDLDKIRREVLAANAVVKTGLLALPFRLSTRLAALTDPREIHAELERELIGVLNDLAFSGEEK
jgi:hypothetical protein